MVNAHLLRLFEEAWAQMNYSAPWWLISSETDAGSAWTLEHQLTVNAHWDKHEVLKRKDLALNLDCKLNAPSPFAPMYWPRSIPRWSQTCAQYHTWERRVSKPHYVVHICVYKFTQYHASRMRLQLLKPRKWSSVMNVFFIFSNHVYVLTVLQWFTKARVLSIRAWILTGTRFGLQRPVVL